MSAYLRKEIRLLLPSFGIALVMAVSVWLIPAGPNPEGKLWGWLIVLPLVLCPALVVMTALDSFGREISSGTFANLLSQPVSRSRIWWTKTTLLAAALVMVFAVWWFSFLLNLPQRFWSTSQEMHATFTMTVLLVLTVYSGGLWSVLLLRQVGAAFWITLIVPTALALVTGYLTEKISQAIHAELVVVIVLVAYSVAGFIWARRLFLRAQDVQWTGGEIALPGWVRLPRRLVPAAKTAGRRPRVALLTKELQLHQSALVVAGLLALLHLGMIGLRHAHGGLNQAWALDFVVEHFWALWLLMPVLIGCTAVAEERKLGTLEGQLCLSARRWTQFIIKLGTALALGIFFGVAVPALFEGSRILPDFSTTIDGINNFNYDFPTSRTFANVTVEFLRPFLPLLSFLPLFTIAVAFVAIAFYASTLARNTLQAIAPAILGILIAWGFLLGAANIESVVQYPLWRGWLIYPIGVPVLTASLAWLTYWNFKRVLVGWPVWRRNLAVFATALVAAMVFTSLIYHRSWELLTRLEPEHGSVRISNLKFLSINSEPVSAMTVTLPDGRLWRGGFTLFAAPGRIPKQALITSQFLGGSNWMNVIGIQGEQLAIQSNGSLWLIETPPVAVAWMNNEPVVPTPKPARHTQIGTETNWQRVVREGWSPAVLLLKTDGTLWEWGTNQFDFKQKWPRLSSSAIRRLGTESDWADMVSAGSSIYLWKKSGLAWAINPYFRGSKKKRIELGPGIQMERYQQFDGSQWRNLASGQPFQVGVRGDGTLWGWGLMGSVFQDPNLSSGQISTETNWVAVACEDTSTVALKADGSLWKWDFSFQREPDRNAGTPVRLGEHNDWVAVAGWWNGVVSLAADGSLWHWQFRPSPSYSSGFNFLPLLGTSRRPELIGNIFNQAQ